jgi:hypothetical protein
MLALYRGWDAAEPAKVLAARLGVTKNAVLGKVHRLAALGIFARREPPIIREADDPRRVARSGERQPVPAGASTLPSLPSEQPNAATPCAAGARR